ncbi:MAG: endopeptidase La [Lachnospiraceae bacterium]|jgi:ATP-dependent Lon protease
MIIVPVYNMVILPGCSLTLQGSYFKELSGVEKPETGEPLMFVFLKGEKPIEDLTADDIQPVAVEAHVDSVSSEGNVTIKTERRMTVTSVEKDEEGGLNVTAVPREEIEDVDDDEKARHYRDLRAELVKFVSGYQWGVMVRGLIMQWKSMDEMVSMLSQHLTITAEEKYQIVEADSASERMELEERAVYEFIEVTDVSNEAQSETQKSTEKLYREEALKKQIAYLQKELDDMHPESISDERRFELAIDKSDMNDTARREAKKILSRMKQEGQNSPEYGMLYEYLDFVTGLQWKPEEQKDIDLKKAKAILDEDHYGMKKVKDRILQQIAVMNLNHRQSGSILLFVGAPGTGKTSIGQSIAKALGRKYVRISLGGVRDEAEIRGHRRTYIGAMPGRIMEGIRRAGSANPVMVLDEVDKLTKDYAGDPSSALLEVLDPEQNSNFTDHYLNVPYDLSNVLFVCTANTTDTIPAPLLNRMEVIEFPGYTASEKFQIAKRHLLPKAMKETGIKPQELRVPDSTIRAIISGYTMESGVRGLKKRLTTLCRIAAVRLVQGSHKALTVTEKKLPEYLDMRPIRHDKALDHPKPGIVTGLAWTAAGGEILYIESMFTKGKGELVITGQLGDVMKESVSIAVTLVKNRYPEKAELFEKNDLHIHVPEGAVPKDGPSAGITLTTAIASLVTGKAVDPKTAMTGEVSLRGLVMPIGGLPEKLMAAQRAGITRVLIPEENVDDLKDVAREVKNKLEIVPVHTVEEVLDLVLTDSKTGGDTEAA